jgi:hypothetical protein
MLDDPPPPGEGKSNVMRSAILTNENFSVLTLPGEEGKEI